MDDATRAKIEETIKKNDVVLFMKGNKSFPQCGFSSAVVSILKELKVNFETVNVLADPAIRDGIKKYSDWPTIPQLYIKGEFVGGSDIVREMHANGELQKLLGVQAEAVEVPTITITEPAVAAFRGAASEADADDALRLSIDARFQNDLFFGPKAPNDVVLTVNGITVAMDAATARRANGLKIDFVQGPGGAGFKIDNPNEPPRVKSLRAEDLKELLGKGEKFEFVDVRNEGERALAKIEGARLLDQAYEKELNDKPKDTKMVFHCHHGMRSQAAAQRFLDRGFTNVWNLVGGIDAWSAIDPKVPRY
jgi:monothiol glutaredoxin